MLQSSLADQIPQIILFKEITLKLCEKENTFLFNVYSTLRVSTVTVTPLLNQQVPGLFLTKPFHSCYFCRSHMAKEGQECDSYQL